MFRRALIVLLALALPACVAATPAAGPAGTPGGRLDVIVTNSILADMVQQVGGNRITVHTLVGSGKDTHMYEPTSADGVAIYHAAVIVENGLGFEPWLGRLVESSDTPARRVVATTGITPLGANDPNDTAPGAVDPHVWHDVANARIMVENVRAGLTAADPDGAAIYATNASAYDAQLQNLDNWIVQQVSKLPAERRKLVTSHDTFRYFAARYGFTIIGTALGASSTDVSEPSAKDIAQLIDTIKAAQVPAIFAENVANPRLMETVASDAGVALGPPLYTDALGPGGSPGATYIDMMRYNVTAIVSALAR